jgi:hypothetical protein
MSLRVLLVLMLCAAPAAAQDKAKGRGKAAAAAPKPSKAAAPAKPKHKSKKAEEPVKSAEAHAAAPPPMAADDEGDVRKEGATDIKTVEFTGLDIEGQLKTPQMLYFLNRLRAEFARPELPHRSFMPELSRSSKEKEN